MCAAGGWRAGNLSLVESDLKWVDYVRMDQRSVVYAELITVSISSHQSSCFNSQHRYNLGCLMRCLSISCV
jgi:hypothetical protein